MKEFPKYIFTASQAQQFEWMKERYPALFKQMVDEPRFVPTGGTWVEMDCNIPSGESFIRQFLYGQRFFEQEFGKKCTEFWLPDTFGYSAQLPQIMTGAGIEFFLTQKLSWNLINKFPHSTFYWQGLDGTKVLSHFPPADTYCSSSSVKDICFTVENHKNKDTSNHSMLLFGFGDGGGGPTRPLLERLQRMENTDEMPNIVYQTPNHFFQQIKKEPNHPIWVGELYFELHRGTYTTHAAVKRSNRKTEFLLKNVELFSSLASLQGEFNYPKQGLDKLWKLVLTNQFHDVIPGTSIGPVYVDAHNWYKEVYELGGGFLETALSAVATKNKAQSEGGSVAFNSLSWERKEVVELPKGTKGIQKTNSVLDEETDLAIGSAPSLGWRQLGAGAFENSSEVTIKQEQNNFILENNFVRAVFQSNGLLSSLFHKPTQRESIGGASDALNAFGNQFMVFEDIPFFWDAWDCMIYHQHKYKYIGGATSVTIVEKGPLRVGLNINFSISESSTIKQVVYLDALSPNLVFDTLVDWHESRKFLKVQFPVDVLSPVATYSIQFGHAQRPTHTNTAWDAAKFEVCGHHWADLSEFGFGVALLNDCKYGYAVQENLMRLSLLRSSKMPDDTADMGVHRFKYALRPHEGDHLAADLHRIGYDFNQPLMTRSQQGFDYIESSAFQVTNQNLIIECVKQPEIPVNGKLEGQSLIIRVWESHGGRGKGSIKTQLPFKSAQRCNLLEEAIEDKSTNWNSGTLSFNFSPFQILTFKLTL